MLQPCPNCVSDILTEMQLSPWKKAQILRENGEKNEYNPSTSYAWFHWSVVEANEMDTAGAFDVVDTNHLLPTMGNFKGELFICETSDSIILLIGLMSPSLGKVFCLVKTDSAFKD